MASWQLNGLILPLVLMSKFEWGLRPCSYVRARAATKATGHSDVHRVSGDVSELALVITVPTSPQRSKHLPDARHLAGQGRGWIAVGRKDRK